jgi:hypothetical protein
VRRILVRDGNGDDVVLYEFQDRRFLRKARKLKLDTGEIVKRDGAAFVVPATGEKLVPISGG